MDLSYDEAQLILRALKCHTKRMLDIADKEKLIGKLDGANTAVLESRMAQQLADKFERGGIRIS